MKTYQIILSLLISCSLWSQHLETITLLNVAYPPSIPSELTQNSTPILISATQKGDVSTLLNHADQNLQIELASKTNIYSKKQAELVLGRFFSTNIPSQFQILSKDETHINGILKTNTGSFKIYYLLKAELIKGITISEY